MALTRAGWAKHRREFREAHPFLYWFTEKFLAKAQNFVYWPSDQLKELYYAINARFKDTYWALNTKLDPWRYHEIDQRMLHGMFETLVDFVEVEKASWEKSAKPHKWYQKNRWLSLLTPKWRDPAAGLKYLEWEMSLMVDEDFFGGSTDHIEEAKAKGTFGKPTRQAVDAKEQFDLYWWWKHIRPNRFDPYATNKEESQKIIDHWLNNEDEDDTIYTNGEYETKMEIEESYYKEDTEMLIRLVNLRRSLWT